jgi:genome maintenance exonuclease 1
MLQKNFVHIPHTFTSVESVEDENGRRYLCEGNYYPSVTTVTGWQKRAFFAAWRKNNQAESRRVIKRGTSLHSVIEKYLLNQELNTKEMSPDILDLFLQIKTTIDEMDNIHALEAPMFSKTLGLAGRVDCVAEFRGQLSIVDFKGSTRLKRAEDIDNYFTQTTAYAIMWQELFNVPIKNICIIISCEDGGVQVFERNPVNYVRKLKNAIDTFREEHNGLKTISE